MLTSREIITAEKLRIVFDTESLNRLIQKNRAKVNVFLNYGSLPFFQFLRTEGDVEKSVLEKIPQIDQKYDVDGKLVGLILKDNWYLFFHANEQTVQFAASEVFKNSESPQSKSHLLTPVFIQSTIQKDNEKPSLLNPKMAENGLFLTDNDLFLKNRIWFEQKIPGGELNIVSFEEACEIVDLYLKKRGKFLLLPNSTINKGGYYQYSLHSKVSHFQYRKDSILEAFANRFLYLLMSLDEMGIQYYSGGKSDNSDTIIYHFNYFISLVTGIFDTLAIRTNSEYSLGFAGTDVSLNSNAGKRFLKGLRDQNPQLRKHIQDSNKFIQLIYQLREVVIHREMLPRTRFESTYYSNSWRINLLEITPEVHSLIKQCKDKKLKYQQRTEWGLFQLSTSIGIEPYCFAKKAARVLVDFCDKYFHHLGFESSLDNFMEEAEQIELFEKYRLGF